MFDGVAPRVTLLGLLPPNTRQVALFELTGYVIPSLLPSSQHYVCHQQEQTQEAASVDVHWASLRGVQESRMALSKNGRSPLLLSHIPYGGVSFFLSY